MVCGLLFAAALGPATAPAQAPSRARFDTRVLTFEPDPGFVSLTLVAPDRTIFGGTFFSAAGNAGDTTPSHVFAWSPAGQLLRTYTITGQDTSANHGVQVAAQDAAGDLYVLDVTPARVLVLDPRSGVQRTYATIPHVPPCSPVVTSDCKRTTADQAPEPDYAAFGPDGSLYVTDDTQGSVFRVPPGGGRAQVWFTDPQLDGVTFGPTGLVLAPDHRTLLLTTAASNPKSITPPGAGALYALPIQPDGNPGKLRTVWTSGAREGPDGFALSRAGNIYMALIGPGVNQIIELSPDGKVLARTPDPVANMNMAVPYDTPSSVQFDGERLIVTNNSFFAGTRSHQVLFDVFAGEPGAPVFRPSMAVTQTLAGTGPGGVSARRGRARLLLTVRPRHVTVGRRVRLHIRGVVLRAGARTPAAGARLRLAGRVWRLNRAGRLTLVRRFSRPHLVRLRVSEPGVAGGRAFMRVRHRHALGRRR